MSEKIRMEHAWPAVLKALGLREEAVLRRAGLPIDLLRQTTQHITVDGYARFWEAIASESGDADLGLRLGQVVSVDMFDPALFAAICSPDLNIAMQRLGQYKRLTGPCRLELDINAEATTLTCGIVGLPQLPRAYGIGELVFFAHLVRHTTQVRIRPVQVVMPRIPANHTAYIDYFGVPITQGDGFSLSFSALDARRPFLTTNSAMWEMFEPILQKRLSELTREATTAEQVSSALLELLPSGRSQMQDVAQALGIGTRTLQRRLSQEGTRFQDVLSSTRERMARHYLTSTELTGTEVAFLLGFDDPNSLFRAFYRWTGTTPERLRAASQTER